MEEFWNIPQPASDYTYVIVGVFLCFLILVTLILKLSADQFDYIPLPSIIRVRHPKPVIAMEKVSNPFTLEINKELSHTDSVHAIVGCQSDEQHPQYIQMFWGVDINPFHQFLSQIASGLSNAVSSDAATSVPAPTPSNILHNIALSSSDVVEVEGNDSSGETSLCLTSPARVGCEDLGTERPRNKYPVVCVQYSAQTAPIMGQISVVHIRDECITDPTRVIMQFVVMRSGAVYPLEVLFVESEAGGGNAGEPVCIICQSEANPCCVILPCKHTCVCCACVQRLESCPMCRGAIASYFPLGEITAANMAAQQTTDLQNTRPPTVIERLENWNERLNQWLGMQ